VSSDRDCTPCDSVDRLVASWREKRPDLDMSSVEVVTRLGRVRDHIDERLATVFANFGLTIPAFAALVTLARLDDGGRGVSQRRLADELGLTPGTVSVRVSPTRHGSCSSARFPRIWTTRRGSWRRSTAASSACWPRSCASCSSSSRGRPARPTPARTWACCWCPPM
jgi:hypothetical protein